LELYKGLATSAVTYGRDALTSCCRDKRNM